MTAPRLAPGQVVAGKYSIRAMLGYGGATATYSAQTSAGRDVVVKMFSPQLSQRSDVLGTLQQVAGVTSALADTGVAVLETGFDPQTGAPYFATDMSPVPPLTQTVERGALGPNDVVMLLRGIGAAVDAAHAQRVVHGALKPTNVFVGPPPRRAVRVGDFGVAVARAALPTGEGFSAAAPWMAPEQMQGGLGGPAADVFSAALVAFYAATGRPYWRAFQTAAPDLAGWQKELAAPRVPPSARAQELGASLPPAFDGALGRALSLNPGERFGSVGELAETLGKASGQPQKLAMTMPLTAMPQAAQEMLRQVAGKAPPAPSTPSAPSAPPAQAQPYDGGSTLAISSPADMQWPAAQGQPPPQQPQAPVQPQMPPQQMPPQGMQPQPMIPTPYGGFQAPPPAPMAPQAGPSFAPPPESAVQVPKSRAALFIVIALVGLVVAAGVVVLVVVMRQRAVAASLPPEATSPPTQPTAAAATTVPPAASTTTAPPPVETQEAGAVAAATGDASASALAAAGADVDAGPEEAELTIVCMPDCDSVKIDDAPLDTTDAGVVPQEPLRLAAGPHTLAAGRATFLSQTRKVTLKPGQKSKETFFLQRPGAVVAPSKPCGKFLERCPN